MPQVFNQKYKEVIADVNKTHGNLSAFTRASLVATEMSSIKNADGDDEFDDFGTIAKAIIETYLGYEITEGKE